MPNTMEVSKSKDVGRAVQDFVDGGANEVKAEKQPDGKWLVTPIR